MLSHEADVEEGVEEDGDGNAATERMRPRFGGVYVLLALSRDECSCS